MRQCDSAESALDVLATENVQLLIADIAMPDVDGYELIRRIRTSGKQTPALAVTAFARSDDQYKAMTSGYTAYCAKPIDGGRLARIVRDMISAT